MHDDIKKYIPKYHTYVKPITVESLFNHINGINDLAEKKVFAALVILTQSPEGIMHSFINDILTFEPGTDCGYSNSGYVVAAVIVEEVSGMLLSK